MHHARTERIVNGRINAKMRFFSANERSKGEGKGKEEEGKENGKHNSIGAIV